GLDEVVVARVLLFIDRLQTPGAVDVRHRRDLCALLLADLVDLQHERHVVVGLEPLADRFAEDRRRERTERLAGLDMLVEDVLHVAAPRVADDGPIAERARTPLHPSLKPADNVAVGDLRGREAAELALIADALDGAARGIEIGLPRGDRL